jgi:hypothetical protein
MIKPPRLANLKIVSHVYTALAYRRTLKSSALLDLFRHANLLVDVVVLLLMYILQ